MAVAEVIDPPDREARVRVAGRTAAASTTLPERPPRASVAAPEPDRGGAGDAACWHRALGARGRAPARCPCRATRSCRRRFERLAVATRVGPVASAPRSRRWRPARAPPLGPELHAVTVAVAAGAPVEQALAAWAGADPTPDLAPGHHGARASAPEPAARWPERCDRVAATLRERRELRAEARALATQARASAGVLTVAPVAFAALVSAIEPGVVAFLVTTPAGLACLAIGLALDGLGALWMARIVDRAV